MEGREVFKFGEVLRPFPRRQRYFVEAAKRQVRNNLPLSNRN